MRRSTHMPRGLALLLLSACCLCHETAAGRATLSTTGDTTALAALGAFKSAVAQAASNVVTVDPTAKAAVDQVQQSAAAPADAAQAQYTYSAAAAATAQPAVAYDSNGQAYLVMPANTEDVAAYQQQGGDAPANARTGEPKVEASGLLGLWALRNKLRAKSQPTAAPAPQVVVLPEAQPTQVASEAAPAPQPTQVLATPTVPTTIGSGGLKVVTSNPISISTPIKTVNPSLTATFTGGGGGLLGSAASLLSAGINLLGAVFPRGP